MYFSKMICSISFLAVSCLFASPSWARGPIDLFHCMSFGDPSIPSKIEEMYGPSPVTGISGNGRLSVAMNHEGTLTGVRWPNPSYYDHVKYLTTDRDEERWGARENEGVFSGVAWVENGQQQFFWLRDAQIQKQYFESATSDTVVTEYFHADSGLHVSVMDTVAADSDVFERKHRVWADASAQIDEVIVLAYANLNPTVRKMSLAPLWDGCLDQLHDGEVSWHEQEDAIVFSEEKNSWFSDDDFSVAIALGWNTPSYQHDLGRDRYYIPSLWFKEQDSYYYASQYKGELQSKQSLSWTAQVNGAISTKLDWQDNQGEASFLLAAAGQHEESLALLQQARNSYQDIIANKQSYWTDWLKHARLPNTDNQRIIDHSYRTLISLRQAIDEVSGSIVASISVQPPYGFDWVRDGAFFNEVLYAAGHPDLVDKHNRFYLRTLVTEDFRPQAAWLTPVGNWPMNMYADGGTGGPIPYEIDETGLGLWTLVRHYEVTGDKDYLRDLWPAIRGTADFLTHWRTEDGLPKPAHEDDNIDKPDPPTLVSSAPVLAGLRYAVIAAEALGEDEYQKTWQARADELDAAIEKHYRHPDEPLAYGQGGGADYLIWPLRYKPANHPRIQKQVELRWQDVAPSFDMPQGERQRGQYEAKALLAIADVWGQSHPEKLEKVQQGLEWIANVNVTDGTYLTGESWYMKDGKVTTAVAMPHVWGMSLFYLASLKAYPEDSVETETEKAE